jgi:L-alanine-DL-glutamate epimerase-like enolase superfamily enzyme
MRLAPLDGSSSIAITTMPTRRQFHRLLLPSLGLAAGAPLLRRANASEENASDAVRPRLSDESLQEIAAEPLLQLDALSQPMVIESVELLRAGTHLLVRVRSRDGAEGLAVANEQRMVDFYPLFLRRVAPFFAGKDARSLESLLDELYRHQSNYKYQGLALWVCVAAAEMAILDLLGRASHQSIGEMFGGVQRTEIDVYRASGNRGNQPEEEVEYLQRLLEETGAAALKFRLGGRMSNNRDSLPGRTERLIPMVREAFGPDVTLYADANSSYDVPNSIRIGRLLEEHDYAFFEEPCPFDHLWETKQIADALTIPIAGGEQELSMRRMRWMLEHRAVDVIQPDLHYFGGFIRSTRVARMANALGIPCTAHMSGGGLGYVQVLHFASYVDDPGAHQEYKGDATLPVHCDTSSLRCEQGKITVPRGPGFGVEIDPDFVRSAQVL